MVTSAMYFILSQLVCEVASGVLSLTGVAEAEGVPDWGAAVISGVLVILGVRGTWGVLVAVGMACAVWVCKARAVAAICVKTGAESTVGVAAVLPPLQADRPSRERAKKRQDISVRRFIKNNLHFNESGQVRLTKRIDFFHYNRIKKAYYPC